MVMVRVRVRVRVRFRVRVRVRVKVRNRAHRLQGTVTSNVTLRPPPHMLRCVP